MTLRKPADALLEGIQPQPAASSAWKAYEAELVTPLFGGGVEAGKVDPTMPFRAASIRGQLRFWWRIAHGPFASTEAMFQREKEIWGGANEGGASQSKVWLRVSLASNPDQVVAPAVDVRHNEAYALGPAFNKKTILLREGAVFQLMVRCDAAVAAQVETTLRWWSSFGGIGSRTRRGAGAVLLKALLPVTAREVEEKQGRLLCRLPEDTARAAWHKAAARLRNFRQGENLGRNKATPPSNLPGRSRWPEPDTLRALSGKHSERHKDRCVNGNFFPRAAFGLPIQFRFHPKDIGEPRSHILLPLGAERMASPLILRPYWDGEAWLPAALLLPGWEAAISQPLAFMGSLRYRPAAWPTGHAERHAAAEQITPMKDRGTDALSAFMAYFGEAR